jgi:hypothetical protein
LFNPILKLLFNPNPLVQTLSTQARLNKEAAARETERERRQTEWNALHFEILNRLVTEVSRASIEMQALSTRVDALAGRVDFADRRVRTLENAPTSAQSRSGETAGTPRREAAAATGPARPADAASPTQTAGPEGGAGEGGPRRKRRRRRGRRSGGGLPEGTAPGMSVAPISTGESELSGAEELEGDESGDEDDGEASVGADVSTFAEGTGAPSADERTDESRPALESIAETASAAVTDTSRDRAEATGPPPVQPTPPSDEPVPAAPVDHPDPGPPDR